MNHTVNIACTCSIIDQTVKWLLSWGLQPEPWTMSWEVYVVTATSKSHPTDRPTDRPTNSMEKRPWEANITQQVHKFLAFYGTRRFITLFTRSRYWSISWARCIQLTTSHPISLRSILILSSHLRLRHPSGLFPSGFPTKILYALLM